MSTINEVQKVKLASSHLLDLNEDNRNKAILKIADALKEQANFIFAQNKFDIENAKKLNHPSAFIDRLTVTQKTLDGLIQAAKEISSFKAVVGTVDEEHTRSDGLKIQKQRIPIGAIAMVYESRPNVTIEAAMLAIKSGNGLILKGGSEATLTNKAFIKVIHDATKDIMPLHWISYLDSREAFQEILKLNQYIDLIIPRGGEKLVEFVRANSTIPVIAHNKGLCHIYVHEDADQTKVKEIILNAKTQRPGVCNALESLLISSHYPKNALTDLLEALKDKNVELYADQKLHTQYNFTKLATEENYFTEYLDMKLSVKLVENVDEAILHIQRHGSHHTEGILSRDPKVIQKFMNHIDASCIAINASTRFNDGGELGLGAELGISTSKLHAYGPMGIKEMTTTRFIVTGQGHTRR